MPVSTSRKEADGPLHAFDLLVIAALMFAVLVLVLKVSGYNDPDVRVQDLVVQVLVAQVLVAQDFEEPGIEVRGTKVRGIKELVFV
jgi:hypothetical protein